MDAARRQRLIDEYQWQLDDMGVGDVYDAEEMVATREECVEEGLAAGDEWICLKVPSHSETEMPADLARVLLDELQAKRLRRGW